MEGAYDSRLGRWLSRDPVENGANNTYSYVSNNPVSRVDPSGLAWQPGDFFGPGQFSDEKAWVANYVNNLPDIPEKCRAKFRDCLQHSLAAGLTYREFNMLLDDKDAAWWVTQFGYGNENWEYLRAFFLVNTATNTVDKAKYQTWWDDAQLPGSSRDIANNQVGIEAAQLAGNVSTLINLLVDRCKKRWCCQNGGG